MKKILVAGISLLVLNSCTKQTISSDPLHYTCDLEMIADWTGQVTLIRKKGHTGDYVSRMDTINPYSISFKKKLGEISEKPVLRAEVSGWLYCNDISASGAIVCAVDSLPGQPSVYMTEAFNDKIDKAKKWTRISSVFYFPKTTSADFLFSAYFWNTGKQEIFLDDMEVRFTTY